jgi:hypothetical protein
MKYRVTLLTASLVMLLAGRANAEVDFVKDVKPILEGTCMKCHVGEKPRGGLRLDSKENLLKGGKKVKVVLVPGKAAESPMYKFVSLPEDDEDRMPPLTEKPLPKADVAKLRDWINEGAKWPEGLVLKSASSDTVVTKDDPGVPITEQEKVAVTKLEKTGAHVIRLAQSTNLLRVDFSLRGKEVKDEDLLLLKDMANLTELNLGGTNITDAGLVHLKPLKNLTRLQLHNTKISDAGLVNLKEMTKLHSLNLYGSAGITDAGLEHLKGLTNLRRLYLWQTKVTEAAANKLSAAVPGLIIDRGYDAEAPKPKDPPKEEKKK